MSRDLKFYQAVNEAIDLSMADDPSVYVMGLGVPDPRGVFGSTLGLQDKYGAGRVMDMPTSENAMTGVAIGSALVGMRPIMTHQRIDFALLATGARPSRLFAHSGIPTGEDGGMLVNQHLQSVRYPNLFGGGDCISLEGRKLARVGVYAVRQNPVLYDNLRAALEGGELRPFETGGDYLLILNMGDGTGVFRKKAWVWAGRLAFVLKNYIDHRFMKRFQVSGERLETFDGSD